MGILRATKYRTLLRLSAAVFVLSTFIVANLSPLKVSAATPTVPTTWADSSHTSITDPSGNQYSSISGYRCITLALDNKTTILSQTLSNNLVALADGTSINADCGNKNVWSVWETKINPTTGIGYALIVNSSGVSLSDPKTCTVVTTGVCTAQIWKISATSVLSGASATTPLFSGFAITDVSTPAGGGSSGAASSTTPTCETRGVTLAWITCPIIDGMANAVDGMYSIFIKPLLVTKPISLDTTCTGQALPQSGCNPTFRTWSSFRVYGDIFLVIALLVVVFGQSIGGGIIDAYAAKKILPRLLLAAILINLSFYIVAFAVDVTNIVGQGIQTLLTQPFVNANAFHISMNAGSQVVVAGGTVLATGLGVAAAVAGLWAISTVGWLASLVFLWPLIQFVLLFVLLPAVIVFLSILITLVLRQGLIVLLVVISPVAFALYCLPNTEKYFRMWWDLLFKTLLVYPVIAVLFSLGNILAVVLEDTSQANSFLNTFAQLLSFIGLLVPLFLIPFAFKISGGLLGRVHEVVTGLGKRGSTAIKGNPNDQNSLQNKTRHKAGATLTRTQAGGYRKLRGIADTRNSKGLARIASIIGGNSLEKEAILNAASKQRIFTQKDNGDDSVINARTSWIDYDKYQKTKSGETVLDQNNNPVENPNYNKRLTLEGKPVKEADWISAQRIYPLLSDMQTIGDYRSGKVLSSEEAVTFTNNYGKMAKQNGLTLSETRSAFTAASFARQNERGEWKHGKWEEENGEYVFKPVGPDNLEGASAMLHEQYYKKNGYDASKAFASQFVAQGAIKKAQLDIMNNPSSSAAQKNAAREELRKVLEIQNACEQNSGGRDPDTGEPIIGLAGASPATKAAFDDMKNVGANTAEVMELQNQIKSGYTWESLNGLPEQPRTPPTPPAPTPPTGGSI